MTSWIKPTVGALLFGIMIYVAMMLPQGELFLWGTAITFVLAAFAIWFFRHSIAKHDFYGQVGVWIFVIFSFGFGLACALKAGFL